MSSIVEYLFGTGGFAPHGYCLSWRDDLVALHVGSDAAIAMAYFSIPFALLVFMRRRADLQYKWVLGLFAAFILLCGLTHLGGLVTLWAPYYGLEGMIKLATAAVSVATAVICWPLIPRLLAIPGPTQLRALNADLRTEVARHGETMAELRRARDDLEARVAERTTELREANERLAHSEDRLRSFFTAPLVGAALYRPDLSWIEINDKLCEMLGYDRDTLMGLTWVDVTHPDDRDANLRLFEEARAGERDIYSMDKRFVRADGTTLYATIQVQCIRDADGAPDYFVLLVQDITERELAKQEMERQADELRRSNQILDGFVHIASHDLREPLRGIRNFAAILEEDAADRLAEEDRAHLATIARLTDRMQNLITDLRTYSRLERFEPPVERVPLDEVVEEALDMLSGAIEDSGARISVAEDLPAVRCNHANMVVVLQNLVNNAIKYTDTPPPEIEIGWRGAPDAPEVYVRDHGIGIDPKNAERIFDMFKRLHPRDAFGGGTGAGLAIVRRAMELSGGSVDVESIPGEGSTFWLRFDGRSEPEASEREGGDGTSGA